MEGKAKMTMRRKIAWVVLVVNIFLWVQLYFLPIKVLDREISALVDLGGTDIGLWRFYFSVALLVIFIVLMRDIPAWEIIPGVNIVLFVAGCLPFPINWWMWIIVFILSVLYLNCYDNARRHKRLVVTFMVLALLGLAFVMQYVARNGWAAWQEWM